MACDGIWEVKENDEAIAFARRLLIDEGLSPKVVCERLMDACLREDSGGPGCDNMTTLLVDLRH